MNPTLINFFNIKFLFLNFLRLGFFSFSLTAVVPFLRCIEKSCWIIIIILLFFCAGKEKFKKKGGKLVRFQLTRYDVLMRCPREREVPH